MGKAIALVCGIGGLRMYADNSPHMIAKKYRLTEREVRKVLSRRKPFFSYMFIANILENRESTHRVAILLSSKVARGSVNRNFWRRSFYDISLPYLEDTGESKKYDIVFVPKKGIVLNHKNENEFAEFEKNIQFLYKTLSKNISSK